jgi:hypothetical protein
MKNIIIFPEFTVEGKPIYKSLKVKYIDGYDSITGIISDYLVNYLPMSLNNEYNMSVIKGSMLITDSDNDDRCISLSLEDLDFIVNNEIQDPLAKDVAFLLSLIRNSTHCYVDKSYFNREYPYIKPDPIMAVTSTIRKHEENSRLFDKVLNVYWSFSHKNKLSYLTTKSSNTHLYSNYAYSLLSIDSIYNTLSDLSCDIYKQMIDSPLDIVYKHLRHNI